MFSREVKAHLGNTNFGKSMFGDCYVMSVELHCTTQLTLTERVRDKDILCMPASLAWQYSFSLEESNSLYFSSDLFSQKPSHPEGPKITCCCRLW